MSMNIFAVHMPSGRDARGARLDRQRFLSHRKFGSTVEKVRTGSRNVAAVQMTRERRLQKWDLPDHWRRCH